MKANKFTDTAKALTEADFKEAEKALGYALPADLRAHYKKYNGGVPSRRYFVGEGEMECEIQQFRPIKHKTSDEDTTIEETVDHLVKKKKLIPDNFIPFANDSGGDFYVMNRKNGAIYAYAMDRAEGRDPATKIADNLEDFVSGMITEDEMYG